MISNQVLYFSRVINGHMLGGDRAQCLMISSNNVMPIRVLPYHSMSASIGSMLDRRWYRRGRGAPGEVSDEKQKKGDFKKKLESCVSSTGWDCGAAASDQVHDCLKRSALEMKARGDWINGGEDEESKTWLLIAHYSDRNLEEGKRVFEEMSKKSVTAYNAMMALYCEKGKLPEARSIFDTMTERDKLSWLVMISGYAIQGKNMSEAWLLLDQALERDDQAWSSMVKGNARKGMPKRTDDSWGELIKAYAGKGNMAEAKRLFELCPVRYGSVWTAMLCGYAEKGMVDRARWYFDNMPIKDLGSWETMIKCYMKKGEICRAKALFYQMPSRGRLFWEAMMVESGRGLTMAEVTKYISNINKYRGRLMW